MLRKDDRHMSEIKNEPNGTASRLDGEAKKAAKKDSWISIEG